MLSLFSFDGCNEFQGGSFRGASCIRLSFLGGPRKASSGVSALSCGLLQAFSLTQWILEVILSGKENVRLELLTRHSTPPCGLGVCMVQTCVVCGHLAGKSLGNARVEEWGLVPSDLCRNIEPGPSSMFTWSIYLIVNV